jgi:putative sulfotransferase
MRAEEDPHMGVSQASILAEMSQMLRDISDSLLPGEVVTPETGLLDDLNLQSIGLARLAGRLQSRYGVAASLAPLFTERDTPLATLTAGELAAFLAHALEASGQAAAGAGGGPARGARGGFMPVLDDGHRPASDNTGVLSEHAPGTTRTLLRLPEGEVEVFTAGDGPALVMMHPLNVGAGVFVRQFASLAGSFRLICVHNPGVGATTWHADVTLRGIATLQRTVLERLSIAPPCHVMGSSFGGLVAQEFALLYPAECASLTLVGCSYRLGGIGGGLRPLPVSVREEFDLLCGDGENPAMKGSRAELEWLLLRCESMDAGIGLSYLRAFAAGRPSHFERLPDIAAPTLIVRGTQDTIVPAKDAHLLYGAIPDARLREIPGAGHYPCLTHSGEVGRLLAPFLADITQAPPAQRGQPARGGAGHHPAAAEPDLERCIIISTGRCGSTMLSALITEEPETLSVYESLTSLRRHLLLLPTTPITGAEYWELMSDPGLQGAAAARIGSVPDEACYPASGRWADDPAGIPPILYCTLPRMSADPDLLFDELSGKVRQFPDQPVTLHHRMLLDLLATMAGPRRWVERSGASSAVAEPLLAALPDLKVVYLTRGIADTAQSMSRHSSFQFAAARYEFQARYGTDPYSPWMNAERLPEPDDLPEEMRRLLPDRVTVRALEDLGRDIGRYEAMCAHMMGSAEQALADLKPRYLHRIRYEDVRARPLEELTALGEFLGFADPAGWAAKTAGMVRPARATSVQPG